MKSRSHLNYDELLLIYKYISLKYSIKQICNLIGMNRSTLYRVIIKNSEIKKGYSSTNNFVSLRYKPCKFLIKCKANGLDRCPKACDKFKKYICPKLEAFPYMCNFCEIKDTCKKEKRIFNPETALKIRIDRNKESKSFPKIKMQQLKEFDSSFSPLIKQGLSVETVMNHDKELSIVTSRTVRNWINKSYLAAKRHDLRNAVTRPYKLEYDYQNKRVSKNPLIKVGRTYTSFLDYIKSHDPNEITQFDTVHGLKGDKGCLLTIHHPRTKFQFGIKLNSCSSSEVINKMLELRRKLGDSLYLKFFRIMLCDNGIEFDDMNKLEMDYETGEIYGKVFYTRPYNSGDKGSCERNHEFFRYFYPKKKSLEALTQEEIDEIFSRINSYPRKSLDFNSPTALMKRLMGDEFLSKLNLKEIPFKKIILKK